jgi:hypothetical protein
MQQQHTCQAQAERLEDSGGYQKIWPLAQHSTSFSAAVTPASSAVDRFTRFRIFPGVGNLWDKHSWSKLEDAAWLPQR